MRALLALVVLASSACAEGALSPIGGEGGSDGSGGTPDTSGTAGVMNSGGGGGVSELCGNGAIDPGEECDGANLDGRTCEEQGYVGGTLGCMACSFDATACLETLCNNGVIDTDEDCDGSDLGTATCASEGFAGGTLGCATQTCLFDTVACIPALNEGFEAMTLPAGFTTGGSANWQLDTTTFHSGAQAAKSGNIGDDQTSSGYATVTYDVEGDI